ncbi:hypothetical protein N7457_003332 [Penicillium paradoxum]|uniref:uncharacterized protein n=1 Tax=Penicillium paradoxum TaxID=176176 RepID=UPI0025499F13|nr:uncharacterized protein N7457_003332 [Penicillium paradoxum]KAJ5788342.1 hypothetical protein N7457_003332 [Penicillium paradoxum]
MHGWEVELRDGQDYHFSPYRIPEEAETGCSMHHVPRPLQPNMAATFLPVAPATPAPQATGAVHPEAPIPALTKPGLSQLQALT